VFPEHQRAFVSPRHVDRILPTPRAPVAQEGAGRQRIEPGSVVRCPVELVEGVVRLEQRPLVEVVGLDMVARQVDGVAVNLILE
jgi:hypothetical protein